LGHEQTEKKKWQGKEKRPRHKLGGLTWIRRQGNFASKKVRAGVLAIIPEIKLRQTKKARREGGEGGGTVHQAEKAKCSKRGRKL